jgi:hypothetical protein
MARVPQSENLGSEVETLRALERTLARIMTLAAGARTRALSFAHEKLAEIDQAAAEQEGNDV